MSDTEKVEATPTPAAEEGSPPAEPKQSPPPSLETEQGRGMSLRQLDAEIESELEAAMGGLSEKELYGEPQKGRQPREAAGKERKKGKILAVHGPDVFVDVPG